jgi:hypothetical protein
MALLRELEIRLGHAYRNLRSVQDATDFLWQISENGVRRETYDHGAKHVYYTAIPEFATERIDPHAADCIHNLRACLDNLVYRMAVLNMARIGGTVPDDDRKMAFPICLSKNDWDQKHRQALNYTSSDGKAFIKGLQPYMRTQPPESDPLWLLSELDNIDKHRFPLSLSVERDNTLSFVEDVDHSITAEAGADFGTERMLLNDAELAIFTVDPPDEAVNVEFDPHFVVVLDEARAAPLERSAENRLHMLYSLVRSILVEAMHLPEIAHRLGS